MGLIVFIPGPFVGPGPKGRSTSFGFVFLSSLCSLGGGLFCGGLPFDGLAFGGLAVRFGGFFDGLFEGLLCEGTEGILGLFPASSLRFPFKS